MSMATNLPILHYFNKYTKFKCRCIINGYFNKNSIFSSDRTLLCTNSYISGSNWNFLNILVAISFDMTEIPIICSNYIPNFKIVHECIPKLPSLFRPDLVQYLSSLSRPVMSQADSIESL